MNRYRAVVESCERAEALAWLRIEGGRLAARPWSGVRKGREVDVLIRPEDVLLAAGHPGRVSARNILPGHVRAVKGTPDGVLVTLDVGFPIAALVTRAAVAQLGIRRGAGLFACVKATAIVPEAAAPRRFRVALVGARGEVSPREIEFLRAVGRTGSIAEAARETRISYRTAWLWVRGVNRAWGKPLVERERGGSGGGGTRLTPEGRAALAFAASVEGSKSRTAPASPRIPGSRSGRP